MTSLRILALSLSWATLSSLCAGDLSRYREFQLDTDLPGLAKQAGLKPADAKVIHQRPALIQEMSWEPQYRPDRTGSSLEGDSVRNVVFSFYNGKLYRMVVSYDRHTTEGLTATDLVEAISAAYGAPLNSAAEIVLSSVYQDSETVKVIARWEDPEYPEYSFNLVHSSYQTGFTLVVLSKRLDALAQAAVTEAVRLDKEEAPQREIERQNRED